MIKSGIFYKGELTRYVDELEVECEEKRVEDDYKILAWPIGRTELPSTEME